MCNHPLHTTSEKKTTNQPNRALWSSDTKTFGKSVIEGPFLKKKASGREKSQDQEGLFSQNLGDQGWGGNMEVGV